MESQHVKSINTDERSSKRIKFASAKQRSKRASADVYRSHKRKIGATSAATREEAVHNPSRQKGAKKRHRAHHLPVEDNNRSMVLSDSKDNEKELDNDVGVDLSTSFANELDETLDRNASEVFGKFHRQVWPLVRSLPEILHHANKIVDLMLSYMLSPAESPERPSDLSEEIESGSSRRAFIVNYATLDILHLMAVIARDLRHEIHVNLHTKILPRIVYDLLNPPPPPIQSGKQPIPLDVTVVESAFRCISYILRYDAEMILEDVETMRKYYGATLGSKRELVRRLTAETFAPLIRKIKKPSDRHRHLKRVLKALAATEGQPETPVLCRTQDDVVDGIAFLAFQIVRGVSRKMHSQGEVTVRFVLTYCTSYYAREDACEGRGLVVSLASAFVDRICHYVGKYNAGFLVEIISLVLKESIDQYSKEKPKFGYIYSALKLLAQVAGFQSSVDPTEEQAKRLFNVLNHLFSQRCFLQLSSNQRSDVLNLACPIWLWLQPTESFDLRLEKNLQDVFPLQKEMSKDEISSVRSMVVVLAKDLIPQLQEQSSLHVVGTVALEAAGYVSQVDKESSLLTVFALATKQVDGEESAYNGADTPDIANQLLDSKVEYVVSDSVKDSLLGICLIEHSAKTWSQDFVERLNVALRCVPFIALLSQHEEPEYSNKDSFKKAGKWIASVLGAAQNVEFLPREHAVLNQRTIITALALEALAHLSSGFLDSCGNDKPVKKLLQEVMQIASKLVFSASNSLWAMRAVATFVDSLSPHGLMLNDKIDEMFDALAPNLSSPSHALRLNTLRILAKYPKKNFVTDHADLDFEGDLDEDPSSRPPGGDLEKSRGPVGKCDIIDTMLEAESMRVRLTAERPLLGLISKVEVLGRTGRLPVAYAEAAAYHMLGLFYVKFSPLWPIAGKALVALAKGQEDIVWPALEAKLIQVMQPPTPSNADEDPSSAEKRGISGFHEHWIGCLDWERSLGRSIYLFGQCKIVQDGEIERHLTTDETTVVESVWEVAEKCQQLVAKHSRVIVPSFLGFLVNQFFHYHSDDVNARELNIDKTGIEQSVDRELLNRYELQKKLLCFLRVFAVVDGPQQLVSHTILEQIFRSFLTHQDTEVVRVSLSCLLKFKPKYLVPYSELVKGILAKGQLRNSLLKFQEALEAGKVADEHRQFLVPVVSRVLFGRIATRESRSAKDSPAARRAAILSFLAILSKDEMELFPFLYLMTRSFVPQEGVKEIEMYCLSERVEIFDSLAHMDPSKMGGLPGGVIEGFLHLLQAIVAQLGHRIKSYIPQLTSVVVSICKFVAVDRSTTSGAENGATDEKEIRGGIRRGAIRTLCYQRLSELFSLFARTIDFTLFGEDLWAALGGSVALLPEMVVKSEKTPALLALLEMLSTEPSLVPLLHMHDAAANCVIRCIASTSLGSVMNSSLSFVENLIDISIESTKSNAVIRAHIPLLLEQFSGRLKSKDEPAANIKDARLPGRSKIRLRQSTWRRELRILCRISELVSADDQIALSKTTSVLEELCELLLPFLEPGQGTSDEDKLNVIGILRSAIVNLDSSSQMMVFDSLSSALAPVKAKPGIESISVRNQLSSLISVLGDNNQKFKKVAAKVTKMTAVHSKRIDEVNFEIVIPELNALGKEGETCDWIRLGSENPYLLAPVVTSCFHYLHNEDGVLARASFNALKTLVLIASQQPSDEQEWTKLVESLVVPPTRTGLQARDVSIRRFYVLIVREIAKSFAENDSPNLCGDLSVLLDEENPDLDFFLGITHVQLHRRGRAFQRLRKALNESVGTNTFTSQSLSSILLPLALHPAYECKTKAEETFAMEGIATVGAISRLLPWNKYNNTLSSIITSFDRHPEQQRYLVGMMCAIIDAFHYDLVQGDGGQASDKAGGKSSVWRALERRIIPKVEGLLTKEKSDRNGSRIKTIRPTIVLALLKLFQKFPLQFFESKLPRILSVMCDALKSRDSNSRDVARTTMAKIVVSMDLNYLADIVREVTITLNEGYKLHVRAAVIHTILQELLISHKPPNPRKFSELLPSSFDSCIASLMDVLQEDLFGVANERRESQETNVRYVKEAGGSKSVHSVEMICRMIRFEPSKANRGGLSGSSIHCVVSPLLERLRSPNIDASTIRKVKEILMRVVAGLSHNPSVGAEELFPFVYATVQPFIGSQEIAKFLEDEEEDETEEAIRVSGCSASGKRAQQKTTKGKVVEWRPSTLNHAQSSKAAIERQKKEREGLRRVQDGASAPKLTGSSRHSSLHVSSSQGLNDPATISAVVFGLNLLHACLKKLDLKNESSFVIMVDPFIPMLTACICNCKDNDVALVAMKCLMSFLRFQLPSLSKCSKSLGTQALKFLSSSGTSLNQTHDMTQACFKTLTYLINLDREIKETLEDGLVTMGGSGEQALAGNATMPLNSEQMKVLLSLLMVSIAESDQHNPALGLIKAILSRRFTSPEFYDLMESMLKLNVRSQKASLRQQSGGIFIRYLLDYPMGEDRFEQHLKQVVANLSYEYQEGRMSAIHMLTAVIEKLPVELLARHSQLLFLPLVLQLVNDDSNECREAVSKCLVVLLSRSSTEVLQSLHDYTVRWSRMQEGPLRAASLQVFGILVESCTDFIRSNEHATQWMTQLQQLLEQETPSNEIDANAWEVPYFALICIEKLSKEFGPEASERTELWNVIVERLSDAHPWIKLASSRIVQSLFQSKEKEDNDQMEEDGATTTTKTLTVLEAAPGLLFEIAKNLCVQLSLDESEQSQDLSEAAIQSLTLALPLMKERPDLCFTKDSPHAGLRDPIAWVMRRLSAMAKPKGRRRRIGVYKCFAALITKYPDVVSPHLELMLDPLHRSDLEASNELESPAVWHKKPSSNNEPVMTEASLARDVLQLLEESCAESPESFLKAYATVKSRARDKKTDRKVAAKAEAVQDPKAAAQRKMQKQQREKHRLKRRVEDRRRDRGAQKKYRSMD